MQVPLTDLKAQYSSIKEEVDAVLRQVIENGQFILGAEVKTFEEEMASYTGTHYAVGVASGTDALTLALHGCHVKPGDEVITTPFTFIATTEAITQCGATPVFVDIDPLTFNLDATMIEAKITRKTSAVIPVHLYGQPADMEPILALGKLYNLKIVEDCAQALGAEYRGEKVGSLGNAGCLSFFPAKNLGAYGDGGMVVTDDENIADTVRMLRQHGSKQSYYHLLPGYNSRLDSLQAAILKCKLKYLDAWNESRRKNASAYYRLLSKIEGIEPPVYREGNTPSVNYYTIRLTQPGVNRDELRKYMEAAGIQTMVYYPLSLHLQKVYTCLGYTPGDFPQSELAQEQVLSLPMYPELTVEQIEEISGKIRDFLSGL